MFGSWEIELELLMEFMDLLINICDFAINVWLLIMIIKKSSSEASNRYLLIAWAVVKNMGGWWPEVTMVGEGWWLL